MSFTQIINSKLPVELNQYSHNYPEIVLLEEPQLLTIPTPDGSGQVVHPAVVFTSSKFGGYYYWMAFTPYPNSNAALENPCIVASNDGLTWVVPAGVTNPLAPTPEGERYNADTQLIYDGVNGKLYVWSQYGGGETKSFRVETSNGTTWSEPLEMAVSLGQAAMLLRRNGDWQIWNSDQAGAANTTDFYNGYFRGRTSVNGIDWTPLKYVYSNTQQTGYAWHLSVSMSLTGHDFLLSGAPKGQGIPNCLYYGYSEQGDIITFNPIPILTPKTGTWYGATVYHSCMVPAFDGKNYALFISAKNEAGQWHIGRALARKSAQPSVPVGHEKTWRRILLDKSYTVTKGASLSLERLNVRNVEKFVVSVEREFSAHNYCVYYNKGLTGVNEAVLGDLTTPADPGYRAFSGTKDIAILDLVLQIKNQDESNDHTYAVKVYAW